MIKETGKLRILGNLGNYTGSKLHRIKLPLDALNGQEVEIDGEKATIVVDYCKTGDKDFTEKLIITDIFYNNFSSTDQAFQIGLILSEYKVKLIEDLDDVFYLNPKNPVGGKFNAANVMRHLALADTVVVTNERLKKHCERFVNERNGDDFKPIHVSNNILPNTGQFEYTPKIKREGKIAFGIIGSISHLPDWELLKGAIKILGNNKKFAKQAKFVIAGYTKNLYWDEIVSWFKGLKCEVEIVEGTDVDNYMALYDKIDVVFAPLVDEEFSWCKSELKIVECAKKDIFLVGGKPYAGKQFGCGIAVESEDWQKWAWELIKDDNYLKLGKEFGAKNREMLDFNKRIESLKTAIQYCANTEYNTPENLKLFGICYQNNQYTEFERYDNNHINSVEQKSYLFEWNPVIDIINNKDVKEEYLGVFSYKFPYKTHLSKKLLEKVFTEATKTEKYDVLGFCPYKFNGKYLSETESKHPGFTELLIKVCGDLDLKVNEPEKVIYSNMQIMKTKLYKDFINSVIKPAITLMETKYKEEAFKDANYVGGLSKEELKKVSGLDNYRMIVFVLERLQSIWLENNPQITFKQLG